MSLGTPGTCEECGTQLVVGEEHVEDADDSTATVAVDWCPNLRCPSNGRPRGFQRISPQQYRCATCDEVVTAFIDRVIAHRNSHQQSVAQW